MTAGRYALSAVGPGLRGDADRTVGVGFAEHVDGVRIMTHPGIDIQGLVTLEGSQQGCPTGFVQLSDGTSGTVTKGTVSLRAATAGVHKVTVRCEGMLALPEYEPLVVAAPPAEPPSPRWSVTRGATITGMFVDSRGDPVAKVAVHAGPTDEIEDALASGSTTSDTEGRFAINGLQEGTHRLLIEAEGYASLADRPKATAVGEGSSPVALRIVLPDGGELAGRVVGDDQAPIAGVGVVANDGSSILSTTSTDDDGNFSFTGLRLGPLRVTLNEGWDEREEPITVDADLSVNPSAPIVIEIPARSHRITGTVVDEEQSPVADAFVRAVPAAVASGLELRVPSAAGGWVVTDEDGRFVLEGLAPEAHTLLAQRWGDDAEAMIRQAAVDAPPVTLRIVPLGSVAGLVVDAAGQPVPSFSLAAAALDQGIYRQEHFTDAAGMFLIDGLAPARYDLIANQGPQTGFGTVVVGPGESASKIEIRLAPSIPE